MSRKSDSDSSDSIMGEGSILNRSRTLSGSLTRLRKNSRIATVKPVTKCLSTSEEDITKGGRNSPKGGSASPGIKRLLSKDMSTMEKDAIVAELEKCLAELENDQNVYTPLNEDYKKIAEERDELANELETAFGELEGYMHHVRDVESDRKDILLEKDDLTKEVEYLKCCLTNRLEIEENSLKTEKENLQTELKKVKEENSKMKDEINDLLEERQSLIESLLNLHSTAVDDVIQTRSRSCSVVSSDSNASSFIRGESMELRDRVRDAEEAEEEAAAEIVNLKASLERMMQEKIAKEKRIQELEDELMKLNIENGSLSREMEKLEKRQNDDMKVKDKKIKETEMEIGKLKEELKLMKKEELKAKRNDSIDRGVLQKLRKIEEKNSKLNKDLCSSKDENVKQKEKEIENNRKIADMRSKNRKDKEGLEDEIRRLNEKVKELEKNHSASEGLKNQLTQIRNENENLRKDLAGHEGKLLKDKSVWKKMWEELEEKITKLENDLKVEREKVGDLREKELQWKSIAGNVEALRKENNKLKSEIEEFKSISDETCKKFEEERSELDKKLSGFDSKQKELEATNEDFEIVKKDLERATELHLMTKEEKISLQNELKKSETKSMQDNENFITEKKELTDHVQVLQSKIVSLKNVETDLIRTKKDLFSERDSREKINEEKHSIEKEMEGLKEIHSREKKRMEKDFEELSEKANEWNNKLEESVSVELKLREADYKLRALEQSLTDALREKSDLENSVKEHSEDVQLKYNDEHQKSLEELRHLRTKLQSQTDSEKVVQGLRSKVEDLNIFIERAETKIKELENEIKLSRNKTKELDNLVLTLRKEKSSMQLEMGSLRSEIISLKNDLDKVTRQMRSACADVERAIGEKRVLTEQLEYFKFEIENSHTVHNLNNEMEQNITSQKVNEILQKHDELREELETEINRLKDEQHKIERDLKNTKGHLEEAQDREGKFIHSIDGLSGNIERLRRDKNFLENALEVAKAENTDNSLKLHRQSQDSSLQKITTDLSLVLKENDGLKCKCNTLQEELTNSNDNNKSLVARLRNMEDVNASAVRSLKARKNELQMMLAKTQHEKEDIDKEVTMLREKLVNHRNNKNEDETERYDSETVEKLRKEFMIAKKECDDARLRITQLEEENLEYKEKINEFEVLIVDLQRAVARANDVAMEKALESSRHKRIFEKKFEKILKENFGLQKQLYFDGPNLVGSDRTRTLSDSGTHEHNDKSGTVPDMGHLGNVKIYDSFSQIPRKKSLGEIHKVILHDMEKEKSNSLTRSGSAPLTLRTDHHGPVIRAKVSAATITSPVRYFSDTDSIGSKPDSCDGENAPPSPTQKVLPPSYYETNRSSTANEQERIGIHQPNRIHRPILLKEIKFPHLSPSTERRRSTEKQSTENHNPGLTNPAHHSPGRRSPGRRSPVVERHSEGLISPNHRSPGRRSPGLEKHSERLISPNPRSPGRRSPGRRSPAPDGDKSNKSPGKERMEHWV